MDGGKNWSDATNGLSAFDPAQVLAVQALAPDPTSGRTWYAATNEGVFKSSDEGANWASLKSGCYFDVAVGSTPPTTAYALACPNTSLVPAISTQDGGRTWSPLTFPNPGTVTTAIAVAPDASGTVYVGMYVGAAVQAGAILRSADRGKSWVSVGGSFQLVHHIVVDPSTPKTIYAATAGGVFRSEDGGDTWEKRGSGEAVALAIDPSDGSVLYAGAAGGVWKTADAGRHWSPAGDAFDSCFAVVAMTIDPRSPTSIYAGTNGDGLFQTADGGANWRQSGYGLPGRSLTGLAVDAVVPRKVYAAALGRDPSSLDARVFRTDDGGARWLDACPGGFRAMPSLTLAADPFAAGTLYAGTGYCELGFCGGSILRSGDGGASWEDLLDTLDVTALALDPKRPGALYAGVSGRVGGPGNPMDVNEVLKSTDGGRSWAESVLPENAFLGALLVDPSDSKTVYAATSLGLFKSTNGGASWEDSSTGLTDRAVVALSAGAGSPTDLFAATPSGVFRSPNGGAIWSPTALTLAASSIAVDPVEPDTVYVGTNEGVFVSFASGAAWQPMNDGLTRLTVVALAIDGSGEFLHAATDRGMVFDLPLRPQLHVLPIR